MSKRLTPIENLTDPRVEPAVVGMAPFPCFAD
jgi:hypothetical protein